jgi:NTP pyrophosphatase (non-canonical NTP hydrolase)
MSNQTGQPTPTDRRGREHQGGPPCHPNAFWTAGKTVGPNMWQAICSVCGQTAAPPTTTGAEDWLEGPSKTISFEQFSQINRGRCESPQGFNHKLSDWSTSDWFVALMGELGEAANVAKKLNRVRDGIPGNKEDAQQLHENLRKELGDAFIYLDLLCQSQGFSIFEAAIEVFNAKSDEIKCPIKIPT